jgi:uncharacterized protein YdcH (DUF465 family)
MLGENHSLVIDFPKFKDLIAQLMENDDSFAKAAKEYHSLDAEIRDIEINGTFVSDESMHLLKHNRSELKDSLYQRLVRESK